MLADEINPKTEHLLCVSSLHWPLDAVSVQYVLPSCVTEMQLPVEFMENICRLLKQ